MSGKNRLDRLIECLNEDLARELGNIIRCTYQAAKLGSPAAADARRLLLAELAQEIDHAAYLTRTIVALGGEPTTIPDEFDKPCSLQVMLEVDRMIEEATGRRYREHATLAGELDRPDLKAKLEEMAAVKAAHARELERVLHGLHAG
jgi:bacterioferritin